MLHSAATIKWGKKLMLVYLLSKNGRVLHILLCRCWSCVDFLNEHICRVELKLGTVMNNQNGAFIVTWILKISNDISDTFKIKWYSKNIFRCVFAKKNMPYPIEYLNIKTQSEIFHNLAGLIKPIYLFVYFAFEY